MAPLIATRTKIRPVFVAIVGGSGSGKTWLAQKLEQALVPDAARVCLDDFYADRSHLTPGRRAQLNFDHPRAIDWLRLESVLEKLSVGLSVRLPCYDFVTHTRLASTRLLRPKPIILLDGLWLLRRLSIRRVLSFSLFLDCPRRTRLQRRLARDLLSRGRNRAAIRQQFENTVEPMHARYVVPQIGLADAVLCRPCNPRDFLRILKRVRGLRTFSSRR